MKITEQQKQDSKEDVEKQVVIVLKGREAMVRDMTEKKNCIVMFGVKEEEKNPVIIQRFETAKMNSILNTLNVEENEKIED